MNWRTPDELKWHSPTGYCKFCGYWAGYTPKEVCKEYGKVQYSTKEFKKKLES
jgi:hypothetical protein